MYLLNLFSNFEVCKAAPDFCKVLSAPITLTSADLPEGYSDLIPLSPFGLSVIEVSVLCCFWPSIELISRVSGEPALESQNLARQLRLSESEERMNGLEFNLEMTKMRRPSTRQRQSSNRPVRM